MTAPARPRIRKDDGLWLVELPGRPPQAATTHAGALDLLAELLRVDDWWRAQDPLDETPRPTSFTALPEPRASLWDYLASPFRSRP